MMRAAHGCEGWGVCIVVGRCAACDVRVCPHCVSPQVGQTALDIAEKLGHDEVVALLEAAQAPAAEGSRCSKRIRV